MKREETISYIEETYSSPADYPWISMPDYAVFRHSNNKKWFAVIMTLPQNRLGLKGEGMIDIMNLKCDPVLVGSLRKEKGFFPAYHMSKTNWITVALDGSVDKDKIKWLLDMSFELTATKIKRKKGDASGEK